MISSKMRRYLAPLFFRHVDISSRSGNAQRLLDRFWSARDDEKICARRSFRNALALLPVPKGVDAEAEPGRERLLRETELRTDRPDVHSDGNMNTVGPLRPRALREFHGLLQPAPDAAHRFRLRYVSTRTFVSRRNAFRSSCERSARSFFANTVSAKSGTSELARITLTPPRLRLLGALSGVGVPIASAVLALAEPQQY